MAPAGWAAVEDVRIEFRSKPPAYPEFAGANSGLTGGRYKFRTNCNCKEPAGRRLYDGGSLAQIRMHRQQRNKGECGVVEILG